MAVDESAQRADLAGAERAVQEAGQLLLELVKPKQVRFVFDRHRPDPGGVAGADRGEAPAHAPTTGGAATGVSCLSPGHADPHAAQAAWTGTTRRTTPASA